RLGHRRPPSCCVSGRHKSRKSLTRSQSSAPPKAGYGERKPLQEAPMNFDFSDDQKFLKSEARKFLEAHCPTAKVRGVLDHPEKAYDGELWRAVGAQGWLGTTIPEEYGGLGLGRLELCVIAEEVGRALAPIPFASTAYFVTEALLLAGSEAQKQAWLPKIAAGEVIGCFATSERPGALTEAQAQARVDSGKLSGAK